MKKVQSEIMETLKGSFHTPGAGLLLGIIIGLSAVLLYWTPLLHGSIVENKGDAAEELLNISRCIDEHFGRLKVANADSSLLKDIGSICLDQLYGQAMLNEFQLRRVGFVRQDYVEKVILWMVVSITVAGVLIAGLQVLASYKLASSGRGSFSQDGEIALQRDKISLRSSVTGLFILIISFAFFSLFVFQVFTIKEISASSGISAPSSFRDLPQLRPGGIGSPAVP